MKNISRIFALQKQNAKFNGWFEECSEFYYLHHLQEELDEVKHELLERNLSDLEEEMGDVIWTLVNLVAKLEHDGLINSERMIDRSCAKFSERLPYVVEWRYMADKAERSRIWAEVKALQKMRKKTEHLEK